MSLTQLNTEAHVWFALPESVQNPGVLKQCQAVLSPEETQRCQRLRLPDDRHRYLISHALVRNVLSKYIDLPPARWAFRQNEHGRPEVGNGNLPPIRFNLTHTAGLVACIVTLSRDCGIDAEKIAERHYLQKVAARVFSDTENAGLQNLEGRRYLEYFFKHWTLREAYVKARGIGMSFPTRTLCFDISGEDTIRVEFAPGIGDRNEHWQLELLQLTAEHVTAVAMARDNHDKQLVVRRFELPVAESMS